MNDYFENIAARILQNMEQSSISESTYVDSPYYLNENYSKPLTESIPVKDITTDVDELDKDGVLISKFVEIAATQILNAYIESKNGKLKPEALLYITDKDLLDAISRKTTQLQSMLKSGYNKTIAKELIEQAIRRQLKYLAYNRLTTHRRKIMLENTKRYLAECGDLEATIAEIESRLDDIEQAIENEQDAVVIDVEDDETEDEICPECGSNPCTCEDEECEDGSCIDDEDVDEIAELDFSNPNRAFLTDDDDEDDEPNADGGLYPYDDEDDEDGPYYR